MSDRPGQRRGQWAPRLFTLLTLSASTTVLAAGKQPLLVVPPAGPEARLLAGTESELGRSTRYRPVLLAALLPLMRQADEREELRQKASALIEEGRQALVSLDHQLARSKLDQAAALLEGGFVRYYDPRRLAEVRVLLGIWALERARPDLARQEFVEAHYLDPSFSLDAHYSPQVRAAFQEAARSLPPRPAPSTVEVRKLLALAGAPVAVVLGVEVAGERALIRGALFTAARAAYTEVESLLVETNNPEALKQGASNLGVQLRRLAEAHYPLPPASQLVVKQKNHKLPPPPPPPRPLWKRWYTWAAAGVVVAGTVAVVLPLVIKREVVETTWRW